MTLFKKPQPEESEALRQTLGQLTAAPAWTASQGQHLVLQHRCRPDSACEWLSGEPLETWDIVENGLRFRLGLECNQNTGPLLDMCLGCRWVWEQAAGCRALSLSVYTCDFSVAVVASGASQVVDLDMTRNPLNRGRGNHRPSGHNLGRVGFPDHELLKFQGKLRKLGPYDLAIVDPPGSQKGSFVLTQDYHRILRHLPGLLVLGDTLLTCINDPAIGPDFFLEEATREAPSPHLVERLENPPEFLSVDPAAGLKTLPFRNAG